MFEHDEIVITPDNFVGRQSYLRGHRVIVPDFEIYKNPKIKLGDITKRRYSLIDRYGSSKSGSNV